MCLREVEQLQQEKQKLDDELRAAEMGMNHYPQQRLVDDDKFTSQAPYKVNGKLDHSSTHSLAGHLFLD